MARKIITTSDGSKTIQLTDWNEQYHSKHGAIQEAYHVFIKNGFLLRQNDPLHILEIGFGTGLNALITLIEAQHAKRKVHYTGIEAYPVVKEEWSKLDYGAQFLEKIDPQMFVSLHECKWESPHRLTDYFTLTKRQTDIKKVDAEHEYDIIYFDAFGPRVQPELWTVKIFDAMFKALKKGGILTTYSAKGDVRRAMLNAGFRVERVPGPPGKREMLIAYK